ncbi:hypothetical protein VLK31_17815 [Variovorax sp. H27-G14]|uniref:hypothetical protein n=1 Tax=Variovorax sp. H27-G14 TaxID=3111914 RepID=UPI0038FCD876
MFALLGIAGIAIAGFSPDGYAVHVLGRTDPQPYPLQGVAWFLGAVLAETALVWALLRPSTYRRSWKRALPALAIVLAVWAWLGMGAMHQPPYFMAHLLWLTAMVFALALLLVVSLTASFQAFLAAQVAERDSRL